MESHWNDEAFVNTFYLGLSTDIKDMQTTVHLTSIFEALVELLFKNHLWEREGRARDKSVLRVTASPVLLPQSSQQYCPGPVLLRSNSFDNMGDIASILEAWDILWPTV